MLAHSITFTHFGFVVPILQILNRTYAEVMLSYKFDAIDSTTAVFAILTLQS